MGQILERFAVGIHTGIWVDSNDTDSIKLEKIKQLYQYFSDKDIVSNISIPDFIQCKDDVILIDCRSERECMVSMIPGAISMSNFDDTAADVSDATLVLYCTIGLRSYRFGKGLLEKNKNRRVLNLEGSILGYLHECGLSPNEALIDPKTGRYTLKVDTFSETFDLLPQPYHRA